MSSPFPVLSRIKVKLNDTEIRIDYLTNENDRGITLVIKVKRLDYGSEAGGDPPDKPSNAPDAKGNDEAYSIPIYAQHLIVMENINFYMEEFRIVNGKRIPVIPGGGNIESMIASEQFHSTISDLPEPALQESTYSDDDDEHDQPDIYRTDALKIGQLNGATEIRLTIKQTDKVQGPKVQLELQLGTINVFLSPRQLHALVHLSNVFLDDSAHEVSDEAAAAAAEKMEKEAELEEQLQQTRSFHAMTGNLGFNQGWSSDLYDQQSSTKDFDDDFMKSASSMSGSVHSFASSATQTTMRSRRRGYIDAGPNADILRLNIRIACCTIVLLEEVSFDEPIEVFCIESNLILITRFFCRTF